MKLAAALFLILVLAGCQTVPTRFPLPTDPAPVFVASSLDAWWAAELLAYTESGDVYEIEPTGSMEPTLSGGDFVVIVPKPFSEYQPFKIALYRAEWKPPPGNPVLHRIVARDAGGLLMSGDANPFSEAHWRVIEKDALGILIAIWRVTQ